MPLTRVAPSLIAVANNVTSNVFGSANTIPSLTFDASGVISTASNTAIQINTADIVNGAVTDAKITAVANTKITGNIISSQIASNITLNGTTTISSINLTGGQITFPATQSASANANTLDDYEEGTWTPAYSGAAGTVTYTQQKGVYTKIGDTVFVSGHLESSATSGATSSQIFITGLPFTPTTINGRNGYSVLMSRKNGWTSAPVGGITLSGQTEFEIYDLATNNNTADSIGTDIASGSTTSLWFSVYYKV